MNWIALLILTWLVAGLQLATGSAFPLGGAGVNWLFALAVFVVLHASLSSTLSACLLLGWAFDLISQTPLGLGAISFTLFGYLAHKFKAEVNHRHLIVHAMLGLMGGLIFAVILTLRNVISATPVSAGAYYVSALWLAPASVLVTYMLRPFRRTLITRRDAWN